MCMSLALFLGPPELHRPFLAAGYEDGSVVVWDVAHPARPIAQRKLQSEPVMALEMHGGGALGCCGSPEDQVVCLYVNLVGASIEVKRTLQLKQPGVGGLAIRQDGKILASAGWDGRVRVFKCSNGRPLAVLKYHQAAASALAFSRRTHMLASGGRDGMVALWSLYRPAHEFTNM